MKEVGEEEHLEEVTLFGLLAAFKDVLIHSQEDVTANCAPEITVSQKINDLMDAPSRATRWFSARFLNGLPDEDREDHLASGPLGIDPPEAGQGLPGQGFRGNRGSLDFKMKRRKPRGRLENVKTDPPQAPSGATKITKKNGENYLILDVFECLTWCTLWPLGACGKNVNPLEEWFKWKWTTQEILESLLFVSETPLSVKRAANSSRTRPRRMSKRPSPLLEEINQMDRSFQVVQIAEGFQLVTRPEYHRWAKELYKIISKTRLSKALWRPWPSSPTNSRSPGPRWKPSAGWK